MEAMDTATAFYHACESLEGMEGCGRYLAPDASFEAQAEPLADITTLEGYVTWFTAVGRGPLSGCRYELHASSYDEATRTASFFGTIRATHSGDGGPVPPTGRSTVSQYVYLLTMDEADRVKHMVKVWNAPWALRDLGWM